MVRLQKKVMDLEARVKQLADDLRAANKGGAGARKPGKGAMEQHVPCKTAEVANRGVCVFVCVCHEQATMGCREPLPSMYSRAIDIPSRYRVLRNTYALVLLSFR